MTDAERAARRAAFQHGVRDLFAPSPGVFAWGLVTGIAMVKSGLSVPEALGMSLLVYAGSAQLAALPLIAGAAPIWIITLTALIVNLRFAVYAAAIRGYFKRESAARRLLFGYLIGDVGFVRFTSLMQREPDYAHPVSYFAGAVACNWLVWQVSSIVGIVAAAWIPTSWGLELAGTLALLALLVPLATRLPALAGVLVAALLAVVLHALPLKLGLLVAVLGGITVAMLLDGRVRRDDDGAAR